MTDMFLRPFVGVLKNPSVYDADTISGDLDIGYTIILKKMKFRLVGIDSPEYGWRAKTERERQLASEAKQYVKDCIANSEKVLVYSEHGKGKYGRLLATFILMQPDGYGINLSEDLIAKGYAREYWGGTKSSEPW